MKSLYDSALSGISKLMSSKIDGYQDTKENAVDSLEAEKQAAEDAYQAQIDLIQEQIDAIDDLIDKKQKHIDAINEEIDKIREASEARKREFELQKAQYELERLQNQRTQLVYDGEQMVYRPDESGIRDARENIADIQEEMQIAELEKQISLIEKEIDLLEDQKEGLEKQQDAIQKMMDKSNEYYDNLIKQTEKHYDSLIKSMEQQKSKWEELADIQEIAEAYSAIEQVFGDLGYSVEDVLNGSAGVFEDFKSKYISLINDMNSNSSFAEGLSYATGVAEENLGSFLGKTQEVADGLNSLDLSSTAEGLENTASAMDNVASSSSTAGENIKSTADGMDEIKKSSDGLSENISNVADGLNAFPGNESIEALSGSFERLAGAIVAVSKALGVGEDASVGGLANALSQISSITLEGDKGEGIVKQFQNLKSAVNDVSIAISGGGSGSDVSNSKTESSAAGNGQLGSEGGGSSLIASMDSIKSKAEEVLGTSSGEDEEGTGVIGQFSQLEQSVNDVATAIGGSDTNESGKSGSESNSLLDALDTLQETTNEILGEPDGEGLIHKFEQFKEPIAEASNHITGISDGLEAIDGQEVECTIKVNIETTGGLPAGIGEVSGTALNDMNFNSATYTAIKNGTAHVEGTAVASGNWEVQSDEKDALVGEVGYEIIVRNGKFFTVGDNGAEIIPIKKGDIVFNHEQSEQLLKYGHISGRGKAYANGTVGNKLASGAVVPLSFFDNPVSKLLGILDNYAIPVNVINNALENQTKQLTQSIANAQHMLSQNNYNQPMKIDQNITISCPNVTNNSGIEYINKHLGNLSQRATQLSFKR